MEVAQRIGQSVSYSTCLEEWDGLSTDYERCMENHKEYRRTAELYHSKRQSCKSQIDRQLKKLKLLKSALQNAGLIQASMDRIPTNEERNELLLKIEDRRRILEEFSNFLPRKNGFYLSLIIGQINVILDSTAEKFRYKDEYEKFKLYISLLTLCYSLLLQVFTTYRVLDAAFTFLLLWYYCTLTVRESILIVNGSRIKGWWVLHHYISVILSGTNVLWTDGESYQEFRPYFMAFSLYQSLVQLMQYYYQSGCLYRLRALGERHNMDITVEGFQSWMWRGLTFLLPFLFFGHFWQLFNAVKLTMIATKHDFTEWQVPVIASLFFILFCGNIFTTISVVIQKQRRRNKDKQT